MRVQIEDKSRISVVLVERREEKKQLKRLSSFNNASASQTNDIKLS